VLACCCCLYLLLLLLMMMMMMMMMMCLSLCSGALVFGDVIDVDRLLLESGETSAAPAPCSVEGFGSYGEPVFTMVEQQLAGSAAAAVNNSEQPSSSGSSTAGMRLAAPAAAAAGDPETPGAYALSTEADSSSSSRAAQERVMLQESALQEASVRQLTSCTPLLTSGRLLGIGGLANCTVSAFVSYFGYWGVGNRGSRIRSNWLLCATPLQLDCGAA
jgi:hypothetical protein